MEFFWGALVATLGSVITGFWAYKNNEQTLRHQRLQWETQTQKERSEREAQEKERERATVDRQKERIVAIYSDAIASTAKMITMSSAMVKDEVYLENVEDMYQKIALVLLHFPDKKYHEYDNLTHLYSRLINGTDTKMPDTDILNRIREQLISLFPNDPRIG
jgi:hypothetical protein